ncbi:hypothetical protein Poly51_28950 [Rubripirellula tenax]|uniref:DUF4112 domain-containing protein n=1 Tax=Rubripirellula tenax TaxID=2528015 RepID=A0A5C6F6U0_9BACT|nr:DUF4112 domain-containing protein [Rubripirellula tenax]TWU56975.1 hypothetical protein Poly51_28950 [Rubripirellula tenax]
MNEKERLNEIQMRADGLARLMDDIITIPFLGIRLGWDSILGFIPGIGDAAGLVSHGFLILQAHRAGARKRVYWWMFIYALIDFVIGAIPVLGDLFDIFWKSNRKSADLLRREIAHQASQQG